ncbi:MAG: hypothetical protein KDD41_13600 [Flavobacteriales bacterium]|nr:hypothetical protein [Flavobacteriales bacterium]
MEQPEELETNGTAPKQRHGCVTAWLILMIVANSISAVMYLLAGDMIARGLPGSVSTSTLVILGIIGGANVMFAIMLMQWKKMGFWGYAGSSIVILFINLSIGLGIGQSVMGLVGIGILYGILQIKKNGESAWEHLQ